MPISRAEDHIVTMGMKYCSTWRDQHTTISRKLEEIDGLAKLHNLADLQVRIADTNSVVMALSTRINHTILEIEATHRMITACTIKPPPHSGDTSADLVTFQENFETTSMDKRDREVEELLRLSDHGTQPEALAFSALTLYTITLRLPPTMINEIRGAKRHGRLMLKTIGAAISKARMEALARSMILKKNISAKKATPREFFPMA
jgi:hypothetical protein